MESLLLLGGNDSDKLTNVLRDLGYQVISISKPSQIGPFEPDDGYLGAVINAVDNLELALMTTRLVRKRETPVEPVIFIVGQAQLSELNLRDDLFDDFLISPIDAAELDVRLKHLLWRSGRGLMPELIEYGPLILNLETYQATISGRIMDLTYMEYELLKFLASRPGKVFSRETLLSRVWGYEYYGGARTVDVHVRRLRAKLGEQQESLIQTVRSVGYRFGSPRRNAPTGSR
ncbi:MAG: response regulator transcription factor [Actinomycetota bacterium]|nr:MAG: response regulator transcription factor [Actinomycetota bacterium]